MSQPFTNDNWPEPIPLSDFDTPPFPLELFPEWASAFVSQTAETTQTPADMAGMTVLSALSAAVAPKASIAVNRQWVEPLNLYLMCALPPASGKSPVFREALAPARTYERNKRLETQPQANQSELMYQAVEERIKELKKKAARTDGENRDKLLRQLESAGEERDRLEVVPAFRLIADNATVEQAATLLAAHRFLYFACPEGGDLVALWMGLYSRGTPNCGPFLSAHDGEPILIDRRGRQEEIQRPLITTMLAVQPGVLNALGKKPELKDRGLLARFLYSVPRSLIGTRKAVYPEGNPEITRVYETEMGRLYETPLHDVTLSLSSGARKKHSEFIERIEPRLIGDLSHCSGWGGKLRGQVARIAGVCSLAGTNGDQVKQQDMEAAIGLVESYLIPHAKRAFGFMQADPEVVRAQHCLPKIKAFGPRPFEARELHMKVKGRHDFKSMKSTESALDLLSDCYWVRREESPPKRGKGRKRSPMWRGHPRISVISVTQLEG